MEKNNSIIYSVIQNLQLEEKLAGKTILISGPTGLIGSAMISFFIFFTEFLAPYALATNLYRYAALEQAVVDASQIDIPVVQDIPLGQVRSYQHWQSRFVP